MKNGDIIYTDKKYRWFSYDSNKFFDIEKNEAFVIKDFHSYSEPYVELMNEKCGYSVLFKEIDFNIEFLREIRRNKLLKLNTL
jgi:hypothetical protein